VFGNIPALEVEESEEEEEESNPEGNEVDGQPEEPDH
jgi:hypothetical protein